MDLSTYRIPGVDRREEGKITLTDAALFATQNAGPRNAGQSAFMLEAEDRHKNSVGAPYHVDYRASEGSKFSSANIAKLLVGLLVFLFIVIGFSLILLRSSHPEICSLGASKPASMKMVECNKEKGQRCVFEASSSLVLTNPDSKDLLTQMLKSSQIQTLAGDPTEAPPLQIISLLNTDAPGELCETQKLQKWTGANKSVKFSQLSFIPTINPFTPEKKLLKYYLDRYEKWNNSFVEAVETANSVLTQVDAPLFLLFVSNKGEYRPDVIMAGLKIRNEEKSMSEIWPSLDAKLKASLEVRNVLAWYCLYRESKKNSDLKCEQWDSKARPLDVPEEASFGEVDRSYYFHSLRLVPPPTTGPSAKGPDSTSSVASGPKSKNPLPKAGTNESQSEEPPKKVKQEDGKEDGINDKKEQSM